MATLAGAAVAETAGQVAERTLISESARLRLEQKRRVIRESIRSSGLEFENRLRGGAAVGKELKRASAISALACLGAVGARVMLKAQRGAVEVVEEVVEAVRSGSFDSADEDDEDAAQTAASTRESSISGARDFRFPGPLEGWTSEDFASVAKTMLFTTCYSGFFQPHWFNVLNSYDWSAIIFPRQLELQLARLHEQLMVGQAMAGVGAAPTRRISFGCFWNPRGATTIRPWWRRFRCPSRRRSRRWDRSSHR